MPTRSFSSCPLALALLIAVAVPRAAAQESSLGQGRSARASVALFGPEIGSVWPPTRQAVLIEARLKDGDLVTVWSDGTLLRTKDGAIVASEIGSEAWDASMVGRGGPVGLTSDGQVVVRSWVGAEIGRWRDGERRPTVLATDHLGRIAVGDDHGVVTLHEGLSGRRLGQWPFSSPVTALALLEEDDGTPSLVSGHEDGKLQLSERGASRVVFSAGDHTAITAISVRSRERLALGDDRGRCFLVDLARDDPQGPFGVSRAPVSSLAWTVDGRGWAIGSADGTVSVWSHGATEPVWANDHVGGMVIALEFSPLGLLVGTHRGLVSLERPAPSDRRWEGPRGGISAITWTKDGSRVLVAATDGTLRECDAASGESLGLLLRGAHSLPSMDRSPDGERLVMGRSDGSLEVRQSGVWRTMFAHKGRVGAIAAHPNGHDFATGGDDGVTRLFDFAASIELRRATDHGGGLKSLIFSRDGRRLAAGATDGRITVRSVPEWDVVAQFQIPGDAHVHGLSFSPDGSSLASGHLDGFVRIFDVAAGCERRAVRAHGVSVESVEFSRDGTKLLTSSGDGHAHLLRSSDLSTLRSFQVPNTTITIARWDPTGMRIALGAADGVLRIFDHEARTECVRSPATVGALRFPEVPTAEWVVSSAGESYRSTWSEGGLRVTHAGPSRPEPQLWPSGVDPANVRTRAADGAATVVATDAGVRIQWATGVLCDWTPPAAVSALAIRDDVVVVAAGNLIYRLADARVDLLSCAHASAVTALAIDAAGNLHSGDGDRRIVRRNAMGVVTGVALLDEPITGLRHWDERLAVTTAASKVIVLDPTTLATLSSVQLLTGGRWLQGGSLEVHELSRQPR